MVARIQAFDLKGNPVNRFFDDANEPSSFLYLAEPVNNNYLDMAVVGDQKMTYIYALYNQPDPNVSGNFLFFVDVYQYGDSKPAHNPLLTAKDLVGARMTADMWHTVYTLNWQMVTDGQGHPAGPVYGCHRPGRTNRAVGERMDPVLARRVVDPRRMSAMKPSERTSRAICGIPTAALFVLAWPAVAQETLPAGPAPDPLAAEYRCLR